MLNVLRIGVLWAVSITLISSCIAQSVINIDTFVDAPGFVDIGPEESGSGTLDLLGFDPATVVGGEKELFIGGDAPFIDSGISALNNALYFSNAFGAAGYRWGENSALNLNASSGVFDLALSEIAGFFNPPSFEVDFSLELISERGTLNETSEAVVRSLPASNATNVILSWDASDFSQINFADLDSVAIVVGADSSFVNIFFDEFTLTATVVPEPYSGTLMALLLVFAECFGLRRQRRLAGPILWVNTSCS